MNNDALMSINRKKVAILHRYGLAGDICCGGHNRPRTIEILHEKGVEVHFFGAKSTDALSEYAGRYVIMHELPFTWDRANASASNRSDSQRWTNIAVPSTCAVSSVAEATRASTSTRGVVRLAAWYWRNCPDDALSSNSAGISVPKKRILRSSVESGMNEISCRFP